MKKNLIFEFKPPMVGSEVARALEELALREREAVLEPIEQKVQQELEVLIARLKVSLKDLGVSLGSDFEVFLDRYLDLKRITNASLASGPGLRRLQDVLDQVKVQIDRELQRNREVNKDSRVAEQLMELSARLNYLAHSIFDDLGQARKQKAVMQHEFKHIMAVIDSIGADNDQTKLWDSLISTWDDLKAWLLEVRKNFLSEKNFRVNIKEQYRGTYLKTWDRFIARVLPEVSESSWYENSSQKYSAKYEKMFDELISKEFLTHSLKNLSGWKWEIEPTKFQKEKVVHRPDARISKAEVSIDIEFKVVGNEYEIWFEVPDKYRPQIPMVLTDILFQLRDAKLDRGISVRAVRSPRSGLESIVLSVSNSVERTTFTRLQEFAAQELCRLFP